MTWIGYAWSMGMKSLPKEFETEEEAELWRKSMRHIPGITPIIEEKEDAR